MITLLLTHGSGFAARVETFAAKEREGWWENEQRALGLASKATPIQSLLGASLSAPSSPRHHAEPPPQCLAVHFPRARTQEPTQRTPMPATPSAARPYASGPSAPPEMQSSQPQAPPPATPSPHLPTPAASCSETAASSRPRTIAMILYICINGCM